MVVETELCAAVSDVLQRLGFTDFVIRLNHRGLLTACSTRPACRPSCTAGAGRPRQAGQDRSRRRAPRSSRRRGIAADRQRARCVRRRRRDGRWTTMRSRRRLAIDRVERDDGRELGERSSRLSTATSAAAHLRSTQPGARPVVLHRRDHGDRGAGSRRQPRRRRSLRRPDRHVLGENIPACGFSLGLERILVVMGERGDVSRRSSRRGADVLVTLFEGEDRGDALALARELRRRGCASRSIPSPTSSASSSNAPRRAGSRVTVLGADERAARRRHHQGHEDRGSRRVPRDEARAARLPARRAVAGHRAASDRHFMNIQPLARPRPHAHVRRADRERRRQGRRPARMGASRPRSRRRWCSSTSAIVTASRRSSPATTRRSSTPPSAAPRIRRRGDRPVERARRRP